jgi:hypothetical protein
MKIGNHRVNHTSYWSYTKRILVVIPVRILIKPNNLQGNNEVYPICFGSCYDII